MSKKKKKTVAYTQVYIVVINWKNFNRWNLKKFFETNTYEPFL